MLRVQSLSCSTCRCAAYPAALPAGQTHLLLSNASPAVPTALASIMCPPMDEDALAQKCQQGARCNVKNGSNLHVCSSQMHACTFCGRVIPRLQPTSFCLPWLQLEAAQVSNSEADHAASHLGKAVGLAMLLRGTAHLAQR